MRTKGLLLLTGLAAAALALVLAGTALAQTPPSAPGKSSDSYHDTFMNRLAAALGVTREKLDGSLTQARNETLDQAVKEGKLTQEQAERMKAREPRGPMLGFGATHPGPRGNGPMGRAPGEWFAFRMHLHDTIAGALGMTPEEMTNQIRSGKTLRELAKGKEQAVKDAILKAQKERLDQAVEDGKLTREQADRIYGELQKRDPLSMPGGAWGQGRGNGPGMRGIGPGPKPNLPSASPRTSVS